MKEAQRTIDKEVKVNPKSKEHLMYARKGFEFCNQGVWVAVTYEGAFLVGRLKQSYEVYYFLKVKKPGIPYFSILMSIIMM